MTEKKVTTDDFLTPIEWIKDVLEVIQIFFKENRIEDKENAEQLIDSYKYAIELLMKEEVE